MPRTLKRRADAISREQSPPRFESPAPPPRQRQQSTPVLSARASDVSDEGEYSTLTTSQNQSHLLVKKLVRLALSSEYSRIPLRRADISTKIFKDSTTTRGFKAVFAGAQHVLKETFGMQLVELPSREKTALKDRRTQATQTKSVNPSSKSWILVSVLPDAYKNNPAIVQPTRAPTLGDESAYTAIYTLVLSLIYLNNQSLPEAKLERYLKRVNLDTYTPFGTLDKLLQRMAKEGYIERRRDTSSGEEVVEYVVGPRGKVEVGSKGVAGMVKSVYGFGAVGLDDGDNQAVREEEQELNKKLERSLGISSKRREEDEVDEEGQNPNVHENHGGGEAEVQPRRKGEQEGGVLHKQMRMKQTTDV